jgi:hypothetical protein
VAKYVHNYGSLFFILLLLAISLRFLLFSLYIYNKKSQFRTEALKTLGKEMVPYTIDASELYHDKPGIEWKDDNKEVVICGVFYEVVSISLHDNIAEIRLVEDKKENELFGRFLLSGNENREQLSELGKIVFGFNYCESGKAATFNTASTVIRHASGTNIYPTGHGFLQERPPAA